MSASTLTDVVVIVAVVALVLARQFRPQRIGRDRRWWLLPAVLVFVSLRQHGLLDVHHRTASVALIAGELLAGLVMGAGWAWTTKVWSEADGTVWARGTKATAAVWVVGLLVRFGVAGIGAMAGVRLGTGAMLLALASSLLVRSGVLAWRAGQIHPTYRVSAAGSPGQGWKDRV
ncbi:DUF1453 domain-containing protein [Streptomyces sp. NBC_01387]|uniref:DUF1453 domain-containing protein n=1 Tax=unclassified Streptomyces TaxID=2593676 RepID=UPI002024C953|nr:MULTISPECIES: DUF1453 domain-containing protein [unclassified Streptomyces]MCX4547726.1 DUF1453 domain-containing protein [Streptomyces sp. NBC_01500]WSC19412.1 DUF1453 domain-containing protein [Streptomyces sp. NBC_01766]WSV53433.1 DUF1453 domain-containing protein [Streptomyces sp. NBC_01014]